MGLRERIRELERRGQDALLDRAISLIHKEALTHEERALLEELAGSQDQPVAKFISFLLRVRDP